MERKIHCIGDCDYARYYTIQAGNGFADINVFRGSPYQRGYGIGSVFKRFGIPLAKFLGRHLLNTGLTIGGEIAASKDFNKDNIRKRLRESMKNAAKDGLSEIWSYIDQEGSGRKRVYKRPRKAIKKRISKQKGKRSRRKLDVFS